MKKRNIMKYAVVAAIWGSRVWQAEQIHAQTRAMGLDCSFDIVNFQTAANMGYEFGWAESTNGSTTRTAFATNITAAPRATFTYNGTVTHFLIGAYHFDHPDMQGSGMTPAQDLGYFLNAAGPYMTAGHMLPVLDQEVSASGGLSFSDYATQFADLLYAAKGIRPLFYSSESLTSTLTSAAATHMAGLWIARPTFTDSQAQTGNPDNAVSSGSPYGGFGPYASQPWNFWQYGGATISGSAIDKDVGHGDLDYILNYTIPALWTSGASGNWNTTSNWNCVNLQTNAATIPGSIENCNVSLISAAAGTINITLSSGTQNIRSLNDSYNLTISGTGNLVTAKSATFNSGSTTTISGGSLSANTLTISSGATLNQTSGSIAATNWVWLGTTFAGSIVNNGTLNLSGGALSGPLIDGGTVQLAGGVSYNVPLTINGAGINGSSVTPPGSIGALNNSSGNNTWSGSVTLGGTGTNAGDPLLNQIGSTSGTLYVTGVIADGAGNTFAKTGNGDVVLGGNSANTFTNLTRIFGGRLIIQKDGALGAAGSTSAATGNTFMLSASSSTIAFQAPANSSGFSYNTFEVIELDGTNSTSGQIDNLGGANTFAGNIGLGGTQVNSRVQSYLGVSSGSLELSGQLSGRSGATSLVPRTITKLGPGALVLSGDSSGTVANSSNAPLVNSSMQISAGAVVLKGNFNAPGITSWTALTGGTLSLAKLNAIGSSPVTLAGGILQTAIAMSFSNPLTIAGSGIIDTNGNSSTYTGSISSSAGSLTKAGAGTFTATNVRTSGLTVSAGTMRIAIGGGTAGTSVLSSLSISPGATFDVGDHAAIVNYSSSSPIGTIRAAIASAYDAGKWDLPGLTSSVAAGDVSSDTGVGYAEASAIGVDHGGRFAGQTIPAQAVLVKYTYYGDENLDGVCNLDDFSIFVDGFNGLGSGWVYGDFNYDGVINQADFSMFVKGFNLGGAPLSEIESMVLADNQLSTSQKAAMLAAVPEPMSGALIMISAGVGLISRRRKS